MTSHALSSLKLNIIFATRGASGAYLSETWNRLDCFIVIAGYLPLLTDGKKFNYRFYSYLPSAFEYVLDVGNINLSAIRTVRVLRPLRAINRIPSEKRAIELS